MAWLVVGLMVSQHAAYSQAKNNTRPGGNPDPLGQFLDKLGETTSTTLDAASAVSDVVLGTTQALAKKALGLIGVPYKYGGNTEDGLDCSGFVKLVFESTTALILPRRADEMSRLGEAVALADLQAGDLVFFNTLRRPNSHVGIYIGDGQFVHAPSRGGKVRSESMNMSYWQKRFDGAKRLPAQAK